MSSRSGGNNLHACALSDVFLPNVPDSHEAAAVWKRTHVICSAPVEIGEDRWVGANSLVLKGVTIGNRSVVAAGSVVTADIDDDCVAAGNPARIVRSLI